MFQTNFEEKMKKHILYSIIFFRKSRGLSDMEKYGRAMQAAGDNTIPRMRIACRITKATDTLSECVIIIAFPLQQYVNTYFVPLVSSAHFDIG
jgi:hypothetical protein